MLSTRFADHMIKDKNIIVPSPFKKALFWPESTIKKKRRKSKEKLPSVITSKAWKDFHKKKELDKKQKGRKGKEQNKIKLKIKTKTLIK